MKTQRKPGLGVTAEHIALGQRAASVIAETHPATDARADLKASWQELGAQGLLGLHISTRYGGQGGGLLELAAALEMIGSSWAAESFVPSVLASALLDAGGGELADNLIPELVDGSSLGAIAAVEPLKGHIEASGCLVLDGRVPALGVMIAKTVVARVDLQGALRWVALDTDTVAVGRTVPGNANSVDGSICARGLRIPLSRVLDIPDIAVAQAIPSVIFGAEAVGIISWCVAASIEYARQLIHYRRAIGQFQHLKRHCGSSRLLLEQARASVWDAARAFDCSDPSLEYVATIARRVAPDSAVQATRDCIRLANEIGYTVHHQTFPHYRRAKMLRRVLGHSRYCGIRAAELALDGQSRIASYHLPPESEQYRLQIRGELQAIAELSQREQLTRLAKGGWTIPWMSRPLGRAAGPAEQVVIAEELQRIGIALPNSLAPMWLLSTLLAHGTESQKAELLGPTMSGDILWCELFSEPGVSAELGPLRTFALRVKDGWRISGRKLCTSSGQLAHRGALLARTDPASLRYQGVTYFLTDMQSAGISVRPIPEWKGGTSMREVVFDDVFIPDADVIGQPNEGWVVARHALEADRLSISKSVRLRRMVESVLEAVRPSRRAWATLDLAGKLVIEHQIMQLVRGRILLRQPGGAAPGIDVSVANYLTAVVEQSIVEFGRLKPNQAIRADDPDALPHKWSEQMASGSTMALLLKIIGESLLYEADIDAVSGDRVDQTLQCRTATA